MQMCLVQRATKVLLNNSCKGKHLERKDTALSRLNTRDAALSRLAMLSPRRRASSSKCPALCSPGFLRLSA